MFFKDVLYNLYNSIKEFQFKYDYILYPIIILCAYCYMYFDLKILTISEGFSTNLISISSALIGFLIAAHSILIAMPTDKKFIEYLKKYGYFKKMFIHILLSIIFFFICLLLCLFNVNIFIASICFILGMTYTALLVKLLFIISFYIMK